MEGGFVPDVGGGEAEVHVVGEEGAPVAEWEAATTQLLEPARQPLHWWARRSV